MCIERRCCPDGVLLFTERYEIQTGGANRTLSIRKSEENYIVPMRPKLPRQSYHRIQMPAQRRRYKTDFHECCSVLARRVFTHIPVSGFCNPLPMGMHPKLLRLHPSS